MRTYIDLPDFHAVDLLERTPDLWLGCLGVDDEHHRVLIFHLFHVLLSDQGVLEHLLHVQTLSLLRHQSRQSTKHLNYTITLSYLAYLGLRANASGASLWNLT